MKIKNVGNKINELETNLAESLTQRTNHYYVGATQKYKTITSAYNKWVQDGRPKATIHIMSGTYNESLQILGNAITYQLSFIGEDKKSVIWETTNGYYKDAPLHYQGDGTIQGITFIASHADNPTYAYSGLAGDVWNDNVGGAYALHVDFSGAGTMLIKDCDLISYQNCALGCGTRLNQSLKLENVNMYSYTEIATGSAQQLSNGGLLYHPTYEEDAENQTFLMKNVNVFSENSHAFTFTDFSPDLITTKKMEFVNCNFASNTIVSRSLLFKYNAGVYSATTGLGITKNSYGNNISIFNSIYSDDAVYQYPALTKTDGNTIRIDNFNTATKIGMFYCDAQGGTNIPNIGISYMGLTISNSATYLIQYAWEFASTNINYQRKYKRFCQNGVWSAWIRCTETLTDILASVFTVFNLGVDGYASATITDANLAIKCGYCLCTTNVPTASVSHIVQTISANQYYGVQYAWRLSTGAKYKRTLLNSVWSSWVAITES